MKTAFNLCRWLLIFFVTASVGFLVVPWIGYILGADILSWKWPVAFWGGLSIMGLILMTVICLFFALCLRIQEVRRANNG